MPLPEFDSASLLRFACVGVVVTLVHATIALGLISEFSLEAGVANAMAFAVATVCSYLANTRWSFASEYGERSFFRFCGVSMVCCVLAAFIAGLVEHVGGAAWFGVLCVAAVMPFVSYVLHRYWTYAPPS